MLTFLFWNLGQSPRLDALARLVERHEVDIVMLAESSLSIADVLLRLNTEGKARFHYNRGNCERIVIYSKLSPDLMRPLLEDHHISIRRLKPPSGGEMLLAVAHLRSKLHQSEASQAMATTEIARLIA